MSQDTPAKGLSKGIITIAIVAVVGVGLALTQPWKLFVDDVVDEGFPVATDDDTPAADADGDGDGNPALDTANEGPGTPGQQDVRDPMPEPLMLEGDEAVAQDEMAEDEMAMEEMPASTAETFPQVLISGNFVGRSHPAIGTATAYGLEDGSNLLRLEDFQTDNGPDLFVYLTSSDSQAPANEFGVDGQFVDLGRLKGNIGNQNYVIPEGTDLASFDTVVIWCKRFGVAFGAADLA